MVESRALGAQGKVDASRGQWLTLWCEAGQPVGRQVDPSGSWGRPSRWGLCWTEGPGEGSIWASLILRAQLMVLLQLWGEASQLLGTWGSGVLWAAASAKFSSQGCFLHGVNPFLLVPSKGCVDQRETQRLFLTLGPSGLKFKKSVVNRLLIAK